MSANADLPSVTGGVTYDVRVTCPHCAKSLHLNQYPYNDDASDYSLAEDELGLALFGTTEKPAAWDGLDIEYQCVSCRGRFTLAALEI